MLGDLKRRILELSVLNNAKLNVKERIGSVEINLEDISSNYEQVRWFDLR